MKLVGMMPLVLLICMVICAVVYSSSSKDLSLSSQIESLLTEPFFEEKFYKNKSYSCKPSNTVDSKERIHFRGTSLGGWLVIEPWITPSLFYQFLGATEKWGKRAKEHVAIDSYTFCTALGKEEANRQLRIHWQSWVTEEQIKNLAYLGIDTVRIPVADWMFVPYEPYIGCWDGAIDELNRILSLCEKYNLKVLLDLHALEGSQNGLDNSGTTGHYHWHNLTTSGTTTSSSDNAINNETAVPTEALFYDHWNVRGGDWIGDYNEISRQYVTINNTHLWHSLQAIQQMIVLYGDHPMVVGIEPVNEPSANIPWSLLREYYHRVYMLVRMQQPHWHVFFHDGFHLDQQHYGPESEGQFLAYCDHFFLDSHLYQAWTQPPEYNNPNKETIKTEPTTAAVVAEDSNKEVVVDVYVERVCSMVTQLRTMEQIAQIPIVVGEWSLAKDNCAMWINGLNDNVPSYPKLPCQRIPCPASYMRSDHNISNAPPDPTKGRQDPYGLGGESYVEYGTCPIDSALSVENNMYAFANAQLYVFDVLLHGQFFWNFRTELETTWDYQKAVAIGWLPANWNDPKRIDDITHGCDAYFASISTSTPSISPTSSVNVTSTRSERHAISKRRLLVIGCLLAALAILLIVFFSFYYCYFAQLQQPALPSSNVPSNVRKEYERIPEQESEAEEAERRDAERDSWTI